MLFSDLLRGIEVDVVLTQTPLITETNVMESFTSLLATSLSNQVFLFAGTSSGDVLQVSVWVCAVCEVWVLEGNF